MNLRNVAFAALFLASTSFAEGVEFSAQYTADVLSVVSGGLSTGTDYLDKLDLELDVDFAELWERGAGKVRIHGFYNNGASFTEDRVGDLQVVSNIEASGGWRLFQFWYEFGTANWSIRAGLYDLNSEFDANEAGGLFLNSSHGIGAEIGLSGRNGPGIYPVSAVALRTAVSLGSATARVVVMDGNPEDVTNSSSSWFELNSEDGVLTVYEIDAPLLESARLWAGYWRYSAEFEKLAGDGVRRGNDGWYIGGESTFRIGSREARWFVRYGEADERFNPLSGYLGLGAVLVGPLATRPADQLGIAVASGRGGGPYRDAISPPGERASRRETTWELTYRVSLNKHVVIQPDVQYVRNPALSPSLENVWIVGCRIELAW